MKRRQNIHQHTCVQHLLSAGCCLVTEGPVGLNRDGQETLQLQVNRMYWYHGYIAMKSFVVHDNLMFNYSLESYYTVAIMAHALCVLLLLFSLYASKHKHIAEVLNLHNKILTFKKTFHIFKTQ